MDIVNMYSVDWVYVKIKKQSLKKVVGYNVSLNIVSYFLNFLINSPHPNAHNSSLSSFVIF